MTETDTTVIAYRIAETARDSVRDDAYTIEDAIERACAIHVTPETTYAATLVAQALKRAPRWKVTVNAEQIDRRYTDREVMNAVVRDTRRGMNIWFKAMESTQRAANVIDATR